MKPSKWEFFNNTCKYCDHYKEKPCRNTIPEGHWCLEHQLTVIPNYTCKEWKHEMF